MPWQIKHSGKYFRSSPEQICELQTNLSEHRKEVRFESVVVNGKNAKVLNRIGRVVVKAVAQNVVPRDTRSSDERDRRNTECSAGLQNFTGRPLHAETSAQSCLREASRRL